MVELLGIDADDTLWHNENRFKEVEAAYYELVASRVDAPVDVEAALVETEKRNIPIYGYGVKGFTLSLIETAVDLTRGELPSDDIQRILGWGKELQTDPVVLLEGVEATLPLLAESYRLVLVTKGDLWHQGKKVTESGLMELFSAVEIVAEKDEATYRDLLERHRVAADRFAMAGNSLRSDVLPVAAIGGLGIHVPFHLSAVFEVPTEDEAACHDYAVAENFAQLPAILDRLMASR